MLCCLSQVSLISRGNKEEGEKMMGEGREEQGKGQQVRRRQKMRVKEQIREGDPGGRDKRRYERSGWHRG